MHFYMYFLYATCHNYIMKVEDMNMRTFKVVLKEVFSTASILRYITVGVVVAAEIIVSKGGL